MAPSEKKSVCEFSCPSWLPHLTVQKRLKYLYGIHCHGIREPCNLQPTAFSFQVWKFYYPHSIDEE